MNKQHPLLPIFMQIRTAHEAAIFDQQLDQLLSQLYSLHSGSIEEALAAMLPAPLAQALYQTGTSQQVAWSDRESVQTFLQNIQEQLRTAPVVTITLAFEPSESMLQAMYHWIAQNSTPGNLLDIKQDTHLIGGAQIIAGGKYRDLSVKKQLGTVFSEHQAELLSLLHTK